MLIHDCCEMRVFALLLNNTSRNKKPDKVQTSQSAPYPAAVSSKNNSPSERTNEIVMPNAVKVKRKNHKKRSKKSS